MVKRKLIATDVYEGRCVEVRYMGPDLLAYVEDIELAGFYLNTQGAFEAAGVTSMRRSKRRNVMHNFSQDEVSKIAEMERRKDAGEIPFVMYRGELVCLRKP